MSEDRNVFLNSMRTAGELYVILSMCTAQPYVVCNPETFDDQIYMYFDGEEAKEEAERLKAWKVPVTAGKIENKQLLMFYTSLHTMGINAIVVHKNGEEILMQLDELVKKIPQPEGKVWVENPSLYLTCLYFMQEFRKQPKPEITREMLQLQEEIGANFERGRFIAAVSKEEKGIPLVKLSNGETYQPIFTDVLEFHKFNRDDKFNPVAVESAKIPDILAKEAKGVVLNPVGLNMPMMVKKRRQEGENEPAAEGMPS